MNLLEETIKTLEENNKKPKDVLWCGSEEFGYFKWKEFKELSDFEYDNGFGHQEVAGDLIIVGNDWWLERQEYDGSEWWEYKTFPEKPKNKIIPKVISNSQLSGYTWDKNLLDLNKNYEQ